MNNIRCPNNEKHTIRKSTTEHVVIGDMTWYDCKQCDISFATGFQWPDEHPKWSEDLAKEED